MQDLTPQFNPIFTYEEEVISPDLFGDVPGQNVGGFMSSPSELRQGNIAIQGSQERILTGSATAPLTGDGIFLGNDGSGDYDFRAGDPAGQYIHYDGSTGVLTVSGAISASSIDIGGSDATSFHVDVDGNTWWGAASFASGVAKISNAGAGTFTNLTVTGGSISGVPISSIPNNSTTDISLLTASHNLVFSSTDLNTIAWTSGTINLSNGRTFSISSGNTGNMAALTYVYLDPSASTTVLQTTTTYSTAIGANKLLLGTAQNQTVAASFIPFQAGQPVISGDQLQALSVQSAAIANLAVTNAKINDLEVSKLTAGTITSKAVTLAVSGGTGDVKIQAGKTDFGDTTAGFILGIDDSDSDRAKFEIGDSTSFISWSGTTLNVQGISQVTKSFTAGENLTAGQAVFIADGTEIQTALNQGSTDSTHTISADADWCAQTFTTPAETGAITLNRFYFYAQRGGTTGTLTASIRATSGGAPTGADIGSTEVINISDIPASYDRVEVNPAPGTLTGGTTYAIVFRTSAGASDVSFQTLAGAGGSTDFYTSVNSGSNWTNSTNIMKCVAHFNFTESGKVYRTHAASFYDISSPATTSEMAAPFIGFVKTTTSRASSAPIVISGEVTGLSGLTLGANYYLANDYGTIQTSAGTVTRKVGLAFSTTALLITNIW